MGELYGSESLPQILCISVLAGGGAAWLAGRAIATTWRSPWHVLGYMALLGAAVRFVHFALFGVPPASFAGYAADTIYVALIGCLSWRVTRTRQMVTQYPWLYQRTSPVTWRERAAERSHRNLDVMESR
jgi:hypothetical protein